MADEEGTRDYNFGAVVVIVDILLSSKDDRDRAEHCCLDLNEHLGPGLGWKKKRIGDRYDIPCLYVRNEVFGHSLNSSMSIVGWAIYHGRYHVRVSSREYCLMESIG